MAPMPQKVTGVRHPCTRPYEVPAWNNSLHKHLVMIIFFSFNTNSVRSRSHVNPSRCRKESIEGNNDRPTHWKLVSNLRLSLQGQAIFLLEIYKECILPLAPAMRCCGIHSGVEISAGRLQLRSLTFQYIHC